MSETLFIISGGIEAVTGIRRAKEMGFYVVVCDGNPQAPGFAFADHKIIVSTYDIEGTVKAALEFQRMIRPIDGVLSIASDVPLTIAHVADKLGLPGISIDTALLSTDKLKMKTHLVEAGIAVPWFKAINNVNELRETLWERGFPVVIKPIDSRGARGVLRLTSDTDLEWAYYYSRNYSPTGRVMAEEFLEGDQVSTESVITEEYVSTPGFVDRNYEYLNRFAPFIIENGGHQPSSLSLKDQSAVADLAVRAGKALGITRGTVKGDVILTDKGPRIIEVAARLSGGWFCTDQIPLGTGVDFISVAIRLACGEDVLQKDIQPKYRRGVAIRYLFPSPGKITAIRGADNVKDNPWVHRLEVFPHLGDCIEHVTDHTKRAGFVIATGTDREEAVSRAQKVIDSIQIVTEAS